MWTPFGGIKCLMGIEMFANCNRHTRFEFLVAVLPKVQDVSDVAVCLLVIGNRSFDGGSRSQKSIAIFLWLFEHDDGDSTVLRKASNCLTIQRSLKFMMNLIFVEVISTVALHARDMYVFLCLTFCAVCVTYKGNKRKT